MGEQPHELCTILTHCIVLTNCCSHTLYFFQQWLVDAGGVSDCVLCCPGAQYYPDTLYLVHDSQSVVWKQMHGLCATLSMCTVLSVTHYEVLLHWLFCDRWWGANKPMDYVLYCCCWSLLYSTILRSWADSLHSHVILHEWLAFYNVFLNIHQSDVLTVLAWPMPHETAVISACSVCTIQPYTISLPAKPHT